MERAETVRVSGDILNNVFNGLPVEARGVDTDPAHGHQRLLLDEGLGRLR